MIRITDRQESGKTRLVLEGKLAGACVRELERCWLTSSHQQEIVVDLTSVGFIDDYGRQLLSKMHQKGIRLVSTRLMTKSLIEEIESEATSH
jgi:anti-anti-sigma regulatory factor